MLVVDDEPIVRDVVVRYLEHDGFETLIAGDGDVARALIEEREPALVVLDVMLPGMDGLSLCRWIRSARACRSSCSPPGARRPTGSSGWTSAPTTT